MIDLSTALNGADIAVDIRERELIKLRRENDRLKGWLSSILETRDAITTEEANAEIERVLALPERA